MGTPPAAAGNSASTGLDTANALSSLAHVRAGTRGDGLGRRDYIRALVLISIISSLLPLNSAVANTALASTAKDLGMPAATVADAATMGTLAIAATIISTGFLADILGRRPIMMAGLFLVIVGGALTAMAASTSIFLVGRGISGVGIGAAFGASFAYVETIAGERRIGSALGYWVSIRTVALLVGGLVGGVLATHAGWRVALMLVPALAAASLLLVPPWLPRIRRIPAAGFDVVGQVLLAIAIAAVLLGVADLSTAAARTRGWLEITVGVVSLAAFIVVERRSRAPVFPIELFTRPVFVAAALAGMLWNFIAGAAVLQFSQLWEYVLRMPTGQVAFAQLPYVLVSAVAASWAGRRLAAGASTRRLIAAGSVAAILGFVSTAVLLFHVSLLACVPGLMLLGFGVSALSVPQARLFVAEAPADKVGVVLSSRTAFGQFGYSLATALTVVLVDRLTIGGVTRRLEDAGVPSAQVPAALDETWTAIRSATQPWTDLGHRALAVAAPSYVHAFVWTMVICAAVVAVVGGISVALLRPATTDPRVRSSR